MEKECWRDTLSKYIVYAAIAGIIGSICGYFRNIPFSEWEAQTISRSM